MVQRKKQKNYTLKVHYFYEKEKHNLYMACGCQENSSPIDRKKSNKKYPSKNL